jgi:hypothetical protein
MTFVPKFMYRRMDIIMSNYCDLSKKQICQFLGIGLSTKEKATKEQLLEHLSSYLVAHEDEESRLLDTFPYELAVGPNELEELLHCSRAERKLWTKEGKIPVLEYRTFRIAGKEQQYPVYDRRIVRAISQGDVLEWRAAQKALAMEHRKAGRRRAAESKKVHQKMRQEFHAFLQARIDEWRERGSVEIAAVFQLAYWAAVASHWAKENRIKALQGTARAAIYTMLCDTWYGRKNEAVYVLFQTPYAQLSFYRPDAPDKITLQLCDAHYSMMREEGYENKWAFYEQNKAALTCCSECLVNIEKDYYALYFLEVAAKTCPDTHFSFHVPYTIGKHFFPAPEDLPRVNHVEQEGTFRFGRTISRYEKIVQPEHDTYAFFTAALGEVRRLYRLDYMHIPPLIEP